MKSMLILRVNVCLCYGGVVVTCGAGYGCGEEEGVEGWRLADRQSIHHVGEYRPDEDQHLKQHER